MNLPLNSLLDRNDATENARYNMVQQQVRPWNVDGESILEALYTVRREDFTPPSPLQPGIHGCACAVDRRCQRHGQRSVHVSAARRSPHDQ